MKKVLISIISIIAFFIAISELEEITLEILALKFLSIGWLWLVAEVINYFYQG